VSLLTDELVGRGEELAAIRAFLDEPGPAALLLEGEAGIGKSSLWQEGLAHAAAVGHRLLVARPAAAEAELSFTALGDLLADVLGDVLAEIPPPQKRALESALLLVEHEGPAHDPRAIGSAVIAVITALAEDRPVVVAIDDLQWLDAASAAVLTFAVRRLRDAPVRLLLTIRTAAREEPMRVADAVRPERLRRLEIRPLGTAAVNHLLRARLGAAFPRAVAHRLYETAGGNPFFALELARALMRRGGHVEPGEPLPVPTTLHDLVGARLTALSPETQDALLVAALSSEPTVGLVGRVLDGEVRQLLDAAVNADAITLEGGRIRFAHPLVASIAEATAGAARRRDVHRRLAEIVVSVEERALHLSLAADGPAEEVASVLELAAERASKRGATDVAGVFAARAALFTPPERTEDVRRRSIRASEHYFDSGALEHARTLLEDLVTSGPPGPLRADALVRLAQVRFQQEGVAPALKLQRKALAEAGDDFLLRAEIERSLAWGFHMDGDLRSALDHARAALRLAESSGAPGELSPALATLVFTEFVAGLGANADLMERAVAIESERSAILDRARWIQALLLEYAGELDAASAILDSLLVASRDRGEELELAYVLNHLARIDLRAGDWGRAEQRAKAAFELTADLKIGPEQTFTLSSCALVDASFGRVESARELIERGVGLAESTGMKPARFELLATRGFLDLSAGDAEAAGRTLGPLAEEVAAAGFDEPAVFRFHGDAAEALLALGRVDEAEELIALLEQRTGRWEATVSARSRGLLEASNGEFPAAIDALRGALDQAEMLGEPFEWARALLALGSVQRRARKLRDARGSLEAALETFEQLGAALWAQKTTAELGRIGGRAPSEGELTAGEKRVASLVVEGRTNKEVAAALFLSVKTVESSLKTIYRKLDIRSRTELAHVWRGAGAPAEKSRELSGKDP
jgi:DNA-binding CsgD family transcriptional regulator